MDNLGWRACCSVQLYVTPVPNALLAGGSHWLAEDKQVHGAEHASLAPLNQTVRHLHQHVMHLHAPCMSHAGKFPENPDAMLTAGTTRFSTAS